MKKAIIGKKIGMTQIFDEAGKVVPVTVIEAGPCVVVQKKTVEKEGYAAVQLGFEDAAEKQLSKPEKGHFAKAGVEAKKHLKEFRLENSAELNVGDIVKAAGCSRRYLEQRFRSRLGRSIRDELLGERIEHVKNLLSSTNLSIGEITERAGFVRESHLGLLFRKATGATMLQWRRENRDTTDE